MSIDDLEKRGYNLDIKNPNSSEAGPGDVDHLLPEYEKLLTQIAQTRETLKSELHEALMATAGAAS